MVPTEPDEILAPGNLQNQLLTHVPEIEKIANIDVNIPFNLDSSNIGIVQWNYLIDLVYENYHQYDGFVIIHGTDTMVYTAAALSFSLLQLEKPVILTGSQRPLSQLRNDARSNLVDAIELATMEIPEVVIVFGQSILRGNRAKKISISSYEAFDSPNYPAIGKIGVRIKLNNAFIYPSQRRLKVVKDFKPSVALINILPSLKPIHFERILEGDFKAFILIAYGAGTLPETKPDWFPFIDKALQREKAVFIGSQCNHGSTDLNVYESGKKALQKGVAELGEITLEAAYVKIMKILSLTDNHKSIYEQFTRNWAGEF